MDKLAWQRNWRSQKGPDYAKDQKLRERYGITLRDYNKIMELQGERCYICKADFTRSRPELDHDHTTWTARKILCRSCNQRVKSVELNKVDSKHLQRRFDKGPYRRYLEEHS